MINVKGVVCVVDTNYILYKNVHSLVKLKMLYGELENSLEVSFNTLLAKYPFKKIYMVSDSRESSWRKSLYPEYKGTRKKDDEIDWEFVFNTYNEFKQKMNNPRIKHVEASSIEGDDWIRYIVNESNKRGYSCIYVASDGDLHQLLDYRLNPFYINIQWRENYKDSKIFLPKGYQLFINELKKYKGDIFDVNENTEFKDLIFNLIDQNTVEEVDTEMMLFTKIIQGDNGDNIPSVLKTAMKTDPLKFRGIGEAGAIKIWENYKAEYPEEINFLNDDWIQKTIPFVLEYKKVDESYKNEVNDNIIFNRKLIHLHETYMPNSIKDKIDIKLV